MKTYLISYDLKQPASVYNYNKIGGAIRSFGIFAKPLESLWLIKTNFTALQVYNYLIKYIHSGDKLLVIHVDNDWIAYNLENSVINWMRSGL